MSPEAEKPQTEETAADQPAAEATTTHAGAKFDPSKLPPPDFRMLISMLATQAFAAMGQIPNPETGQPMVELGLAKHMIEMLAVIETKTKGNLTTDEEQMLENALHELRMGYVAMSQGKK
ncbi:DUF1844 domain-containing protein [Blastopirellula retiformator]|uniref:DUF1844 domain-containing protein n=1 Tax=Blastopirellula retiformator TaxID=2527970 RepID=A0A5C5UV59_9BACT|nr:DUF1844 domain-containing protein [Blastopirellula retiformator]TWT29537.1 hypothetical protein Enr8_50540 [Blastopirellula retiformator]